MACLLAMQPRVPSKTVAAWSYNWPVVLFHNLWKEGAGCVTDTNAAPAACLSLAGRSQRRPRRWPRLRRPSCQQQPRRVSGRRRRMLRSSPRAEQQHLAANTKQQVRAARQQGSILCSSYHPTKLTTRSPAAAVRFARAVDRDDAQYACGHLLLVPGLPLCCYQCKPDQCTTCKPADRAEAESGSRLWVCHS